MSNGFTATGAYHFEQEEIVIIPDAGTCCRRINSRTMLQIDKGLSPLRMLNLLLTFRDVKRSIPMRNYGRPVDYQLDLNRGFFSPETVVDEPLCATA